MGFDMLDKQNQDFHSVLVYSSTSIVLEVGSTVILLFVQDDITWISLSLLNAFKVIVIT